VDSKVFGILIDPEDTHDLEMWVVQVEGQKEIQVFRKKPPIRGAKRLVFYMRRVDANTEVTIRKRVTKFVQEFGVFHTDIDHLIQERLRFLLKGWNLHEVYSDNNTPVESLRIHVVEGKLSDASLDIVKKLDRKVFLTLLEMMREKIDG